MAGHRPFTLTMLLIAAVRDIFGHPAVRHTAVPGLPHTNGSSESRGARHKGYPIAASSCGTPLTVGGQWWRKLMPRSIVSLTGIFRPSQSGMVLRAPRWMALRRTAYCVIYIPKTCLNTWGRPRTVHAQSVCKQPGTIRVHKQSPVVFQILTVPRRRLPRLSQRSMFRTAFEPEQLGPPHM